VSRKHSISRIDLYRLVGRHVEAQIEEARMMFDGVFEVEALSKNLFSAILKGMRRRRKRMRGSLIMQ